MAFRGTHLLCEERAVLVDWQASLVRAIIHPLEVEIAVLFALLIGQQVALEVLALCEQLLPLCRRQMEWTAASTSHRSAHAHLCTHSR